MSQLLRSVCALRLLIVDLSALGSYKGSENRSVHATNELVAGNSRQIFPI